MRIYSNPMVFFLILFTNVLSFWKNPKPTQIELVTNYGRMVIQLYDETPFHRDNFVKLVRDGLYDSLQFHRIIENFMVQVGDTQSKNATLEDTLGGNDLGYRIPAEIHPLLFHKKGAIGAARTNNPERASSSTQFYIVQGRIQNDSLLAHNENRINQFLAAHYASNDPANKPLLEAIAQARSVENHDLARRLSTEWSQLIKEYSNFERYQIPQSHREVYLTVGGTPHLDQSYTVFGEVIEGLEIIDQIAAVETDSRDRPMTEVRILSMKMLP